MQLLRAIKTLAFGSLGAGIINLLAISITARLLEPEYFGAYAVFSSLATIISVISTMRAEVLICQKVSNRRSECFFKISIFFVVIVSFLSFLFFSLFGDNFFKNEDGVLSTYLLLACSIFMLGLFQSSLSVSLHKKDYKKIAKVRFLQALLGGSIQVTLAFYSEASILPLILGFIIGQGFGAFSLVPINYFFISKRKISECKWLVIKYNKVMIHSSMSTFLLILSPMLPAIIISKYIGVHEAGLFYFAIQTTTIPFTFFRRIFSNVTMAEIKTLSSIDIGKYVNSIKRPLSLSLCTIFVAYVFYFINAESLYVFVFGEEWRSSGKVSAILIPMFFFDMFSYSCFQVLNLKNKTSWLLKMEAFRFLSVVVGVLLITLLGMDFLSVVTWYSFWMLFSYATICYLAFVTLRNESELTSV